MINRLKNFRHFLVPFILIGCNTPENSREFDRIILCQEITEMLTNYHDAVRQGGLLAEVDYLDQSDNFFWVSPGYDSTLHYDSVKAILDISAKTVVSLNLDWEVLKINPLI